MSYDVLLKSWESSRSSRDVPHSINYSIKDFVGQFQLHPRRKLTYYDKRKSKNSTHLLKMNISPIFSYFKWGFSLVMSSFSGGGKNSQLTHFHRCGEAVPAGSERLLRYVQRTVGLPSQSKTGTPLKAVRKGPNQLGLKAHHLMTSAIHPLKTWKIMEFPHVQGGKYIFIHGGFSIVMLVFRVVIIFLNFKNSEHQRNRNAKPTPVCW